MQNFKCQQLPLSPGTLRFKNHNLLLFQDLKRRYTSQLKWKFPADLINIFVFNEYLICHLHPTRPHQVYFPTQIVEKSYFGKYFNNLANASRGKEGRKAARMGSFLTIFLFPSICLNRAQWAGVGWSKWEVREMR